MTSDTHSTWRDLPPLPGASPEFARAMVDRLHGASAATPGEEASSGLFPGSFGRFLAAIPQHEALPRASGEETTLVGGDQVGLVAGSSARRNPGGGESAAVQRYALFPERVERALRRSERRAAMSGDSASGESLDSVESRDSRSDGPESQQSAQLVSNANAQSSTATRSGRTEANDRSRSGRQIGPQKDGGRSAGALAQEKSDSAERPKPIVGAERTRRLRNNSSPSDGPPPGVGGSNRRRTESTSDRRVTESPGRRHDARVSGESGTRAAQRTTDSGDGGVDSRASSQRLAEATASGAREPGGKGAETDRNTPGARFSSESESHEFVVPDEQASTARAKSADQGRSIERTVRSINDAEPMAGVTGTGSAGQADAPRSTSPVQRTVETPASTAEAMRLPPRSDSARLEAKRSTETGQTPAQRQRPGADTEQPAAQKSKNPVGTPLPGELATGLRDAMREKRQAEGRSARSSVRDATSQREGPATQRSAPGNRPSVSGDVVVPNSRPSSVPDATVAAGAEVGQPTQRTDRPVPRTLERPGSDPGLVVGVESARRQQIPSPAAPRRDIESTRPESGDSAARSAGDSHRAREVASPGEVSDRRRDMTSPEGLTHPQSPEQFALPASVGDASRFAAGISGRHILSRSEGPSPVQRSAANRERLSDRADATLAARSLSASRDAITTPDPIRSSNRVSRQQMNRTDRLETEAVGRTDGRPVAIRPSSMSAQEFPSVRMETSPEPETHGARANDSAAQLSSSEATSHAHGASSRSAVKPRRRANSASTGMGTASLPVGGAAGAVKAARDQAAQAVQTALSEARISMSSAGSRSPSSSTRAPSSSVIKGSNHRNGAQTPSANGNGVHLSPSKQPETRQLVGAGAVRSNGSSPRNGHRASAQRVVSGATATLADSITTPMATAPPEPGINELSDDQLNLLIQRVEQRVLSEIERRGGRHRGGF